MNLALSDEQVFLREAARGALSRFKTLEAAREALDGDETALPDLWPTACEAGWPGLLIDEAHGGAGLDAFDAMLVLGECGRVLAAVPLLGHLPATRDPQRLAATPPRSWRARERRAASRLSARAAAQRPRAIAGARTRRSGLERGALPTAGAPTRTAGARERQLCVRARRARARAADRRGAAVDGKPVGSRRSCRRVSRSGGRARDALRRDPIAGARLVQGRSGYRARRARGVALGRLVPRAGADRRRVARQRRNRTGDVGRLRQGALYVRPRDRLLPGRQALADRGAAPARERALAALLRRLGARTARRQSSRSRPAPRARSPDVRSTTPRAR